MNRKVSILAFGAVLSFIVAAVCLQAEPLEGTAGDPGSNSARLIQNTFDRESCEQDCQERYGVAPYRRSQGPRQGDYYLYARCIEACNKKFWKSYDQRFRELEKEKP